MTSGLIVFIVVVAVDVLVLFYDAYRIWIAGILSISGYCWDYPELALPLVAWQLLGALGLAYHLFVRPGRK